MVIFFLGWWWRWRGGRGTRLGGFAGESEAKEAASAAAAGRKRCIMNPGDGAPPSSPPSSTQTTSSTPPSTRFKRPHATLSESDGEGKSADSDKSPPPLPLSTSPSSPLSSAPRRRRGSLSSPPPPLPSSPGGRHRPGGGLGSWKASRQSRALSDAFGTPGAASHRKGTLLHPRPGEGSTAPRVRYWTWSSFPPARPQRRLVDMSGAFRSSCSRFPAFRSQLSMEKHGHFWVGRARRDGQVRGDAVEERSRRGESFCKRRRRVIVRCVWARE